MNPHQESARALASGGLPFEVRNGRPGLINLLDALNSWQLVSELSAAAELPAAASFKHVSPSGAAVAVALDEVLARAYQVQLGELSPLATAYARARGADRVSAFGDWAALSATVDEPTARVLAREVSDGIIAPGYERTALEVLRKKKDGGYCVIEIDPSYAPPPVEARQVFGVSLEQARNTARIGNILDHALAATDASLKAETRRDALVALATLKYTQSNSIVLAKDGQTIGIGAGQQSRIACTRIACEKAEMWWLRRHPRIASVRVDSETSRAERDNAIDLFVRQGLSAQERAEWIARMRDVVLGSDAYIPFTDNIDRAAASGVRYVVQTGGSRSDALVSAAATAHGMTMIMTGVRLFHH